MQIITPKTEYVTIPGKYKIAYHLFGDSSKEPVFCVHGLTRNARDFDYLASSLADRFFVIAVDVVGRGESDWVDSKFYSYDHYLADMHFLIKKHFGFSRVNWIGTSMGGIIGMIIAAKYPNLIKKMILNDIGTNLPRKSLDRIAKYVGVSPKFLNFQEAKQHIKVLLSSFGIEKEEDWDHVTTHSIKKESDYFILNYDPEINIVFKKIDPENPGDVSLKEIWQRVRADEIFVIKGDKSDILLQDDLEYMLTSKLASGIIVTSHLLKNVGHAPALMSEEEIEIINKFL